MIERWHPQQIRTGTQLLHLPDEARSMGIYAVAGKGSGKSRLLGRQIAWQDFLRGVPQLIFDPNGPTVDNFLDRLQRLPPARQAELIQRVRYVDMGGRHTHVVPWPLYYRLPHETLYECALRPIEVFKLLDPELSSAPILGGNALQETGTLVGMTLAALGYQITEAYSLLQDPESYLPALGELLPRWPELRAAHHFLRALPTMRDRGQRTSSFLNKITMFGLDPTLTAMFGADKPGIDWSQVAAQGETVLLDFREETSSDRRRFKMLWTFHSFLAFIKHRGAGRYPPFGLIVDELTALYNFAGQGGTSIFAAALDELINVLARNYRVWLTLCHQEFFQVDEKTRKTLMGMGTKIVGVTQDMEAALVLAQELIPYDPRRIKRYEPVFAGLQGDLRDLRPIEWTIAEQQLVVAQFFTQLPPFHFLVKPAVAEGNVTGHLVPMNIANFEPGVWVDEAQVRALREQLRVQTGQPVAELLERVEARQRQQVPGVGAEASPPAAAHGRGSQVSRRKGSTLRENQMTLRYGVDDDDLETFREPHRTD